MALRDYLNVESRQDLRQFVLQNGQAVAVVIMNEQNPIPLETWYFKADSLSVDNNTSVIRPNAITEDKPGRYILNTTEADWNLLKNKPNLAAVATSGNYNDLTNKLTAGNGVILQNNELKVDDSKFLSVTQSNQTIAQVQADVNTKAPLTRTITVNGVTQDLTTNRSWEVGNLSSTGNYSNPTWLTALAASKITGLSNVATTGSYADLSSKPTIPVNTSQLNNDSGFLTSVSALSWDSISGRPSFASVSTSGSYLDLTNKPVIPNNTNQLTNGAGFISTVPPQSWLSIIGKPTFSTVSTSGDYVDLINKPTIPTNTNELTNGAGFISTVPPQAWSSILNKPSFASVATSGAYVDLTGKPVIPTTTSQLTNDSGFLTAVPAQSFASLTSKPTTLSGYGITDAYPLTNNPAGYISSVPAQSWTSITGKPSFSIVATTGDYADLANKPIIPTNNNQLSNGAGYLTTIPAQTWSSLTGKPTTLSGYGITDAYPLTANPAGYLTGITQAQVNTALGIAPINTAGARTAISLTNTGISGNATYNSTTGVLNIPNYSATVYTGSTTVTSGGNSTYNLTVDGTPTGAALFTNVTFATPFVNDSNTNYTYGWNYNATTKVLTVNTKSSTAVTVAGVSVLGIPNNVPTGTIVTVLVRGN